MLRHLLQSQTFPSLFFFLQEQEENHKMGAAALYVSCIVFYVRSHRINKCFLFSNLRKRKRGGKEISINSPSIIKIRKKCIFI
jgi:hypothetical protein